MRLLSVFRKSLREQLREVWLVFLILVLTPFFIVLYWVVFSAGTFAYKVVVLDEDQGAVTADGSRVHLGEDLVEAFVALESPNGAKALSVLRESDVAVAEAMLRQARAHAMVRIGPRFSEAIVAARQGEPVEEPARLVYSGDLGSTGYLIAAVQAVTAASDFVDQATGDPGPVRFEEVALGGSAARTELDVYIPGLFVFAVILLIFPTCMALARESEAGTLRRLQLTRMTAFDLLGGLCLFQVSIGILCVGVAFATAAAIGFQSQGPLWLAMLVTTVASFACIGIGLLVACFSRSVTEAFLLGNFPMILLMFFSGSILPVPKLELFTVGSVTVGLWDVLPTTHAVSAMNKVVGLGVGPGEVVYELVSLVVLSAVFFAVGVWLFHRRRMAAA